MTMAYSGSLQEAVYARLTGDTALGALVGTAIYDAVPTEAEGLYVTLGEERVRDFSTKTSLGGVHTFSVNVYSPEEGFAQVKAVGKAVCEALIDAPLVLAEGVLVGLHFVLARADRGDLPSRRSVTLQFRAVVDQV